MVQMNNLKDKICWQKNNKNVEGNDKLTQMQTVDRLLWFQEQETTT